jgi:hypothetical protein
MPISKPQPLARSGRGYEALVILLSLVLGAAVVIGLLALSTARRSDRGDAAAIDRPVLTVSRFAARIGRADPRNEELHITGLDRSGRALASTATRIDADALPFLHYRLDNRPPLLRVYFFWRTAERPQELFSTPLPFGGYGETTLRLMEDRSWSGTVTEIGIDVYGELGERPLVVREMAPGPDTTSARLAAIRSDWLQFRPWRHSSINQLPGSPATEPARSATTAAALWAALAASLVALIGLRTGAVSRPGLLAAIAVPWLALDLLWQGNLSRQLAETRQVFAGKTQHEKALASFDGELYSYMAALKSALPAPGRSRVFVLYDSQESRAPPLRAHYHLLPHNVNSLYPLPPVRYLREGDYLIDLRRANDLELREPDGMLVWNGRARLRVTVEQRHPLGNLYRVTGIPGRQGAGTDAKKEHKS